MSIDRIPLPNDEGSLWLCGLRDVSDDPAAVLSYTGAATIVCLNELGELERRAPAYIDWLRQDSNLDPLRERPGFRALLERPRPA